MLGLHLTLSDGDAKLLLKAIAHDGELPPSLRASRMKTPEYARAALVRKLYNLVEFRESGYGTRRAHRPASNSGP